MPFFALIHIAVALYFGVHAIRTGRNMYWLIILLSFPFLGSVVYCFAEYLPEVRHSRVARKAVGALGQWVDPQRALRQAQADFERTPTVDHRARLADALLALGRAEEALEHYRVCASGPYAKDVKFRLGLARAQRAAQQPAAAAETLGRLLADEPSQRRTEASLWYAQALAEAGDPQAEAAFEQALQDHHSTETLCAYGLFLAGGGRDDQARQHLEAVVRNAKQGTAHSREINRAAIDQARAALKQLDQRGSAPA